MATFVSMLNWGAEDAPSQAEVRAAIDRDQLRLWAMGMHSIIFLPQEEPAAVMVSTCDGYADAAKIAGTFLGDELLRIDSMRVDEEAPIPSWLSQPRRIAAARSAPLPAAA
jgi:hypothetical protein